MPKGYPNNAQDNPVFRSPDQMSDQEIGQGETRGGTDPDSFEPERIARVSEFGMDAEKMAMLAFMAEPITIRIATSTDRQAEQVFEININGKMEFFRRGETKTVARYFADHMMRMKQTVFGQAMVTNNDGVKSYIYPPSTGLKYDFSIIRDDNPKGKMWERAVLAEPG